MPKKETNLLQSSNSSKKQKTLDFRRLPTTTSAVTSSNATTTTRGATPSPATSSNATASVRSVGTSSSTSTIATVGGKENNVLDEENDQKPAARKPAVLASTGGQSNATSSNVELVDLCSDEEDDQEPAAGLRPLESGYIQQPAARNPAAFSGHRTTHASNASRPSAATSNRTQSLLSPPATPVMKDRLEHGDLHPADEVQIENALTKASAIMKLATLPDKDFFYLHTVYGWILSIIQFTEPTKEEVKNVVMPITNACGHSMVTIGQAYVDGRFKRAEDIDDTYGPHTHRYGESRKCPIMVIGNAGVCAQVEQWIVDLQGDRATNQRREGIKANGKDTYGREISFMRPGYIYYNICHDYIHSQEQYLNAKKNTVMKQTATLVWRKFREYGLRRYIKHVTAEMAEGIPRSAENDTDVVDKEESMEAVEYETMMAELDTAVEIVSDTLPIIDNSNDVVILDTLSDNLRPEIVDIIMEHPDGGMLDDAMGSLVQNWFHASSTRYTKLRRIQSNRFRGIITSITDEPLAAFKLIGHSYSGPDAFMGLVRGASHSDLVETSLPSAAMIKEAGIEGILFANGHLRVRECYPADLLDYTSFDDMMMAWRNNPAKALALKTANDLSLSASNLRKGQNNGRIIVSCAETFTGAVEVTSGVFERTLNSLTRFSELLEGPSKIFHIAGGSNGRIGKQLKARLQDPNDRCELDAIRKRGVGKLYPAFRLRYADEK